MQTLTKEEILNLIATFALISPVKSVKYYIANSNYMNRVTEIVICVPHINSLEHLEVWHHFLKTNGINKTKDTYSSLICIPIPMDNDIRDQIKENTYWIPIPGFPD